MKIFSDKKKLIQYLFGLAFVLLIASIVVSKLVKKHYTPVEKAISAYQIKLKFRQAVLNYGIKDLWIKDDKKYKKDDDSLFFKYKVEVPKDLPIALLVNEITDSLINSDVKINSLETKIGGETLIKIYSGDNLKLQALFNYNEKIERNSGEIGIIINLVNGVDKEEFQELLKSPERFCFLLTASKSTAALPKEILQDQKEYAVLISDKNTDLDYKISKNYSTGRISNSIKAIVSDFSSSAFIVLDDESAFFKTSNMSYVIKELRKRKITLFKLSDFYYLQDANDKEAKENFRNLVIKNTGGSKKILLLSPEQYSTVKDQLVALRKKGYKFIRPSAL